MKKMILFIVAITCSLLAVLAAIFIKTMDVGIITASVIVVLGMASAIGVSVALMIRPITAISNIDMGLYVSCQGTCIVLAAVLMYNLSDINAFGAGLMAVGKSCLIVALIQIIVLVAILVLSKMARKIKCL